MSSGKQREWKKRQTWQDASAEIGQALAPAPEPHETVQQIADGAIADSPYQAREGYDDAQLAALVEGMRETGFQGVLFARPHPEGSQGGQPRYQLAYGHRRRLAWRQVCAERNEACVLPVVVRTFTDQQMLTIGAQENLQRADLNPLEEAQLVVWHQKLYYPAGLGEIGRLLGKSEDWAKTRARVAQLPAPLQNAIRRRPQLMTSVLEASRLWSIDSEVAQALVGRAEQDGLPLKQIRQAVAERLASTTREEKNDQRVDAPIVDSITNSDTATSPRPQAPAPASLRDVLGAGTADRAASIVVEATQMHAWLQQWERDSRNPDLRAVLLHHGEQLLHTIQHLVDRVADKP